MYQVLYRKWRPALFEDVYGQNHITETLRKQVDTARLSHAYLFTGTRGTGKTTCAKILSRAVNCLNPKNGDPCNECASCVGIMDSSILDVIEIDAASNSGVDNIRALREETVYSPVAVRYRVYIIDEVHMLSVGAFNALLKTLEEPPSHVLFILATTETHKVPATIISRCQRFAFRRIPPDLISERLLSIAQAESIGLSGEAAALIAGMSDGALRDAISILDQCAGARRGISLDTGDVYEVLGLADSTVMVNWARELAQGDMKAALARLDSLYGSGRELSSVIDQLSTLLRDLLMAHMLRDIPAASRYTQKDYDELLPLLSVDRLIAMIRRIQETQANLMRGFNKRLEVELCVIKLSGYQPPGATLAFENPIFIQPEAKTLHVPVAPPSASEDKAAPDPPPEKTGVLPEAAANPKFSPKAQEVKSSAEPDGFSGLWREATQNANSFHKSFMENAAPVFENGKLSIIASDEFSAEILKQDDFRTFIAKYFPNGADVLTHRPVVDTQQRLDNLIVRGGGRVTVIPDAD